MLGSVIVDANPVLDWEQFHLNLDRRHLVRPMPEYRDNGGNWKFTFGIHPDRITRAFSDELLENGGMRRVRLYSDQGILEWGGFLAKIIQETGTVKSELSLGNVFNRQWTRYNDAGTIKRSTKINDTDSQARIGIKERVVIAGEVSLSVADQGIQQLMNWTSFLSPSTRQIDFGGKVRGTPSMTLTALGWWHTLGFRTYNQTALTGDADASLIMTSIVDDVGEFVVSKEIEDNVSQLEREFDADRKANEIVLSIATVGDGGFNRWIAGMGSEGEFYYKQAARPVR